MKERESFETPEEKRHRIEATMFESLYRYPMRLAEQVIEQNLFNDELNQEIREFHESRVKFIHDIYDEARELGLV